MDESQIIERIQINDKLFNKDEIIAWSKNIFIKLQQSYSKRDFSEISVFESSNLFEKQKKQLEYYFKNNIINIKNRVCILSANLHDYTIANDIEILTIRLEARMQDYIIDASSQKVKDSNPNTERTGFYFLTFERKLGDKTTLNTTTLTTTNCPHCCAPTQITSSGKCAYCGSIISTVKRNWILSDYKN